MLQQLCAPLLQCYTNTSIATLNTKVAVGHCLAEICSSLSLTTDASTVDPIVSKILSAVVDPSSGMVATSNQEILTSLRLLAAIADRAPMAYTRVGLPSLQVLATSLVENNELVTETLARVYLEQQHFEKAIEAYKKLSLKYPKKSSFFADQINLINYLKKK